jgi:hypothetical protein
LKKSPLATILIATLVASSTLMLSLATANPAPLFPFPWYNPDTAPPTLELHSPVQDANYDEPTVFLNVSVVKPETWFPNSSIWDASYLNAVFGNVTAVYYRVDGGERQDFAVHDVDSLFEACSTYSLNYTANLTVTPGRHSIMVGVEANSYYVVTGKTGYELEKYPLKADTTVNFNVDYYENPTNITAESTPQDTVTAPTSISATQTQDTTIILTVLCSVAVAVTCLSILAFLRRHKH